MIMHMSQPVAWLLLLGGTLMVLAGLAVMVMLLRPRATRDPIELPELLEPRTTLFPQVDLFEPEDRS